MLPAGAVTVPPHVVAAFPDTSSPLGRVSVSEEESVAAVVSELVKVSVRVEVPPARMVEGANALESVGGAFNKAPPPVAPTLSKTFSPASITAGGASTLVITLSNSNSVVDNLSAALTDTLPTGTTAAGTATTTCAGGTATAIAGGSTVTLTGGAIPATGSCTISVSVTATAPGSFLNSIGAGSLQTDNGSNGSAANANLTVTAGTPALVGPTLSKSFTPNSIVLGAPSTLVLTLSNNNAVVDTLSAPLVDRLPSGLTVNGAASTTCAGGVVTATNGSSTVTLTGGAIPANGSCTVSVGVAESTAGTYLNSIAAGGLQTNNGNSGSAANAGLTVSPVATPVLVAPTLGNPLASLRSVSALPRM